MIRDTVVLAPWSAVDQPRDTLPRLASRPEDAEYYRPRGWIRGSNPAGVVTTRIPHTLATRWTAEPGHSSNANCRSALPGSGGSAMLPLLERRNLVVPPVLVY